MNEKAKISKSAKNLLWLAGGHMANIYNYCSVLSGGGDDITGMIVSDEQLKCWKRLGAIGEQVFYLLLSNGNLQGRAYGCRCYDLSTVDYMAYRVKPRSELCLV